MIGTILAILFFVLVISACCCSDSKSSSNSTPNRNATTRTPSYNSNVHHSYGECPSCGSPYYNGYCDECGYPDINQGWIGENY